MVNVPVRAAEPFGATENCTVPPPTPDDPETIVSQGAELVEVHVHSAVVTTPTEPLPPATPID